MKGNRERSPTFKYDTIPFKTFFRIYRKKKQYLQYMKNTMTILHYAFNFHNEIKILMIQI